MRQAFKNEIFKSNNLKAEQVKIGVVIPCYNVQKKVLNVIASIPAEVSYIYIIDDACPEKSGLFIEKYCNDKRVKVSYNSKNLGVGGSVKCGYKLALANECDIIVKLDGDGQMDGRLIPLLIKDLRDKRADYVKGNRFYDLSDLKSMPKTRLIGNSCLSLVNKITSGYWDIMDPTNGFTAINQKALSLLPLDKIDDRYFFESDMLFRLSTIRAVVNDCPMKAFYNDENSGLEIRKVLFEFPFKYAKRFLKRIFYIYFLRDFNIASIELIVGSLLFFFGVIFGSYKWILSINQNSPATSGTVMLAALPLILGFQLLISGLNFDLQNIPSKPICR